MAARSSSSATSVAARRPESSCQDAWAGKGLDDKTKDGGAMRTPEPMDGTEPIAHADQGVFVVYAEDDERLARLTTRYLESHGVRVLTAADGREGLSLVLRERPDVLLLDLMLPGMDGLEVCRQVRARADTPIIMVTARGEEIDRVIG